MNPDEKHTEHVFFVYHPDTNWTPGFSKRINCPEKGLRATDPQGRYCGRTDDLDYAIVWMLKTREMHKKRKGPWKHAERQTELKIHLLIPAYQRIVIDEPVCFPKDLTGLTVYGATFDGEKFV